MEQMTHGAHEAAPDPHTGHKVSGAYGSHERHAGHSVAMFRDKFWLSLAFTVPVIFWSTDVQHWLGYTAPFFPGSKWIAPILGTVPMAAGADVIKFDSGLERIYVACGSGAISIFHQDDPTHYRKLQEYAVEKKVHSIVVDQQTHRVYTPEEQERGKSVARMVVYEAVR